MQTSSSKSKALPRKKTVVIEEESKQSFAPNDGVVIEIEGDEEVNKVTDLRSSIKKATLKKGTAKKVVEKLYVSFENPYHYETEDENDLEQWEKDRENFKLSRNLQENIEKILEEKTDLDVRLYATKPKKSKELVFELKKRETSTTPFDTTYIKNLVYEHLPHYTEVKERHQRMRSCKIKELDGKFYLFVMSGHNEYGHLDSEEIIEMAFRSGDYEMINFSD